MATGATYHITATASGLGNFSNIDELPRQLTQMHMAFKPQTQKQDVTVILSLPGNIYTAGVKASKYVRVVVEISNRSWSRKDRDELLRRVGVDCPPVLSVSHASADGEQMYDCIVRFRGSKAEKVDIIVQAVEIEDEATVLRNGRWGMWATARGASGNFS